MMLVALANNLGILWVAVEGTTLASVFLVMFYGRETSLEAAWKYAIIGGVGLSMALFGTILTYYSAYRALGTDTLAGLNWSVLAGNAAQFDKPTMRLAFILILLGYGTKAGIAPMHTWKPDAYSEAPIPGAAMLATGVLNCALYGLVRFYILSSKCLGPQFGSQLLILFGLLSMGVAVPFILVQKNFRRLLAYSSIDHSGIMVLALGFGGPLGILGMLLHMTFHSVTKPLLFFCAGNVQQHLKTDLFRKAKGGLIHSMPLTGAAFLMVTLAVTGSPPFSLFQSEFTILRAGFARGHFVLAIFFVSFLVLIFSGFLVHIANLVLGEDPGLPRGRHVPLEEILRRGFGCGDCRDGLLDTRSIVQADSGCSGHRGGWMMTQSTSPQCSKLFGRSLARRFSPCVRTARMKSMFFSAIPTFGPSQNTCEANSGPGWLRCSPKTGAQRKAFSSTTTSSNKRAALSI